MYTKIRPNNLSSTSEHMVELSDVALQQVHGGVGPAPVAPPAPTPVTPPTPIASPVVPPVSPVHPHPHHHHHHTDFSL